MVHDTRVIPIDGRASVSSVIKQYIGNSRCRWEGDTLVIDTTGFTDRTSIGPNGNGTRHSDQMKITEWEEIREFGGAARQARRWELGAC
jgi:hypothetical protein